MKTKSGKKKNYVWGVAMSLVLASAGWASAQTTNLTSVLTWTNTDVTDQVQVDRGPAAVGPFTKLSTVPAAVLTYTDATNAPGTTVCYRVANVNTSGLGPFSNVSCKTFLSLPTAAPVLGPIP